MLCQQVLVFSFNLIMKVRCVSGRGGFVPFFYSSSSVLLFSTKNWGGTDFFRAGSDGDGDAVGRGVPVVED